MQVLGLLFLTTDCICAHMLVVGSENEKRFASGTV